MKREIAFSKLVLLRPGLVPAVLVFSFSNGGTESLRILVVVFSILTGILLAVVPIFGDPNSLFPGSWRIGSAHRREIRRVLVRYTWLIYLYLIVILLSFIGSLEWPVGGNIVRQLALALGASALVFSFSLPYVLYQALVKQLDEEVERRKKAARISETSEEQIATEK